MNQWNNRYDFEWLPGFKEMMACQENGEEKETTETVWKGKADGNASSPVAMDDSGDGRTPLLPPEELQQEEQRNWNDLEYMIRILPAVAKEIWAVTDALLDRFEYEGSSMYAEYPDQNAILKIADMVYDKLQYYETEEWENRMDGTRGRNLYYLPPEERNSGTAFRHMIVVMLCWNMAYRRQRYRRRKKLFSSL